MSSIKKKLRKKGKQWVECGITQTNRKYKMKMNYVVKIYTYFTTLYDRMKRSSININNIGLYSNNRFYDIYLPDKLHTSQ